MIIREDHFLRSDLKRLFKINWAQRNKAQTAYQNLYSVYVGDLHKSIDRFSSVKESKVIVEKRKLNNHKVYGFVYFQDQKEAIEAIRTMNGSIIKGFEKTSSQNPLYQQYPKQKIENIQQKQPKIENIQQEQPKIESKHFFYNYNPKQKNYSPYTSTFYEKQQKIEEQQQKIYIECKINLQNQDKKQEKVSTYDYEQELMIEELFN